MHVLCPVHSPFDWKYLCHNGLAHPHTQAFLPQHAQYTHIQMGPILLPQPLMREVKRHEEDIMFDGLYECTLSKKVILTYISVGDHLLSAAL